MRCGYGKAKALLLLQMVMVMMMTLLKIAFPAKFRSFSHVYGYVDTSVWIFGNRLFCSASSF